MKEFKFGKASNFQPAPTLKIKFAVSVFQGVCLAFKNLFFQQQLSLAASISPLKSVSCSLI